MADSSPERQRMLRRRRKHERQAVVFGSLVAGLALAGLGAAAVYTETISVPFLERDFSSPEPGGTGAALPPPPCPPEGTLPVQYNAVQVNVYNGGGRSGLAGETSESLTTRGFVVLTAANYPAELPTSSMITFGEAGLAAGYTLAAHLPQPLLVMDQRTDATVDLVVGTEFGQLVEPTSVVIDPAAPLVGVPGCVPLEEARAAAPPAPTPATAPTPSAPVEGEPAPEG